MSDDRADLEERILGAPRSLTREQVSDRGGMPEPAAREIWRALGFPTVAAEVRAFTERDAEALTTCREILASGLMDEATLLVLARTMGQSLSRLAEAQVDAARPLDAGLSHAQALDAIRHRADQVLPRLESLVVQVWRRQLAAATARSLGTAGERGLPETTVGFVDLVDYTRLTRGWRSDQLSDVLERFERETSLRVGQCGGRVVKTLGDEVMFVAPDVASAAEIALGCVEAHEDEKALPDVRVGLAYGEVVLRLGDVFGSPVNLASRLTGEARPGTVLVDLGVCAVLWEDPAWLLKPVPARPVRGYDALRPHVLRRGLASPHDRPDDPAADHAQR